MNFRTSYWFSELRLKIPGSVPGSVFVSWFDKNRLPGQVLVPAQKKIKTSLSLVGSWLTWLRSYPMAKSILMERANNNPTLKAHTQKINKKYIFPITSYQVIITFGTFLLFFQNKKYKVRSFTALIVSPPRPK
jgi:hypothetical protein